MTSVKHFIGIAFVIHQVDSLFIPFHGKIIFCVNYGACAVFLIDGNLIPNLDLSHNTVKLLECHLRLSHHLHIQTVPC